MAGISKPPKRPSGEKTLFALQLEKGLRKGEHTYVMALIEINPDKYVEVPCNIPKYTLAVFGLV